MVKAILNFHMPYSAPPNYSDDLLSLFRASLPPDVNVRTPELSVLSSNVFAFGVYSLEFIP